MSDEITFLTNSAIQYIGEKTCEATRKILKYECLSENVPEVFYAKGVWNTHYDPVRKQIQFGEECIIDHVFSWGRSQGWTHYIEMVRKCINNLCQITPAERMMSLVIHEVGHAAVEKHFGGHGAMFWKERRFSHGTVFEMVREDCHGQAFTKTMTNLIHSYGAELMCDFRKHLKDAKGILEEDPSSNFGVRNADVFIREVNLKPLRVLDGETGRAADEIQ